MMQDPNYLAIVVSAIIYMIIGAIWYHPSCFGKMWMQCCKIDKKEMESCCCSMKSYIGGFIAALVMAWILSNVVNAVQATTIAEGASISFWMWLGFVAPVLFSGVLWCKKPLKLYFINAGYVLVGLLVMGAILSVWH